MGALINKAGDLILRLWQQGKMLLWAIAVASACAFLTMAISQFFGLDGAAGLFAQYGLLPMLASIVFFVLAGFRTWEDRPSKTVHLIANEGQSFWGQFEQKDGRIHTQFALRMKATNLTDHPILLTTARLLKPRIRRKDNELARHVATQHPMSETFGFDNQIPPRNTSPASYDFIVDRPIGKAGATIVAVLEVSDERGTWHKVRFEKLRSINNLPRGRPAGAKRDPRLTNLLTPFSPFSR